MEAITVATLVALVIKTVDLVKNALARRADPVVTQLVVWVAGIAVIWLAASASITAGFEPWQGVRLGDLDGASIVFAGLLLGGAAMLSYDLKKGLDGSDSARQPSLMGDPPPA